MWKWLLLGSSIVSGILAAYCFVVSRAAQKVVAAVNGPPVLQKSVDFSRPFTNEFLFRKTVQPFYGTMYLTLKADPWPKDWETAEIASEDLKGARGEIRVASSSNVVVAQRELDWFYSRPPPRSESKTAPLQGFFGRLPVGEYRLILATTAEVPQLNNTKQELVLRYDLIHEATIATTFRTFSLVSGIAACAFGYTLLRRIRRRSRR